MEFPLVYEINTRCWLGELSAAYSRVITLAEVPDTEIARWQHYGFTHIWLMGVWTTGSIARRGALSAALHDPAYVQALPDLNDLDIQGSPYAIADYSVPSAFGGDAGLQVFRARLNRKGMKLILDFVPNHLGLDHPWLRCRPELFVQASSRTIGTFSQSNNNAPIWLAHGKDPNFPAWIDTAQLDYRRSETHKAMSELLVNIASCCDGVRCDMAMLVLPEVFERNWNHLPNLASKSGADRSNLNFWPKAIQTIRRGNPEFLFLAEVYWGCERRLQELGFDYTYDKELYDRIIARDAAGVQRHLLFSSSELLARSAHFLENHDERRIASVLNPREHFVAALLVLALPGLRLLHEGQLFGFQNRVPVQLQRRQREAAHPKITEIYERMLAILRSSSIGRGKGELLRPIQASNQNSTSENIIIIQWQSCPTQFELIVINLAPRASQAFVNPTIPQFSEQRWNIQNLLDDNNPCQSSAVLTERGFSIDLPAHSAKLLHCIAI